MIVQDKMANKVHEIWAAWMSYVFCLSKQNSDGSVTIPKDMVAKWLRQMNTPYEELPDTERYSDNVIAEEILLLVKGK